MEWNIWALAAFLAVTALPSLEAQSPAQSSDFGWGRWSDYTECSRSCGGGIQQTIRKCENGRCQGRSAFYRSCNTQECPEHSLDYRTEQCRSYNSVRMEVQGITRRHSWRPYFDPSAPCALICQNEYGHVQKLRNTVVDGTHCDNGKAFGVCIKGICKPVGCDHRLGSFINEDKCLQCGGTGDGCRTEKGSTIRKRLNTGKKTVVATIPDGAMTLRIKLISTSPSALELMSEEGKQLRLTEATVSFGRHKIASFVGTLFTFSAMRDTMEFSARGPTNESMQLMVRFRGLSPLVEYEYSVKEDQREGYGKEPQEVDVRQGRYKWIHGSWTPCSTECGPGYQLRAIKCVDNEKGQQTNPSLCPRELMPKRNQSCDLGRCETIIRQAYKWIPGHWGECSEECGMGEQVQLMHCIETGTSGKSVYADEELCTRYAGAKPKYERVCRGESENCAEWTTDEWTECSVTCGYGRQTREVLCQRKDSWSRRNVRRVTLPDEECDEMEMPLTERLCHMGSCRDGSNGLNLRRPRSTQAPTQPVTCSRSRYGCCRDGVTFARGRNEEGCPREEPTKECSEEKPEGAICRENNVITSIRCNTSEQGDGQETWCKNIWSRSKDSYRETIGR